MAYGELNKGKGIGGRGEVGVPGGLEEICFLPNRIAGLVDQKNYLYKPVGW